MSLRTQRWSGPGRPDDEGPILVLTIDRPRVHNALDAPTRRAISGQLRQAPQSGVRCVVLTGAGDRTFCAGNDLSATDEYDPGENPLRQLGPDYPLPTVCALNGSAIGNGLELAAACDLRVAAETARLWLPEAGLGFAATDGGVALPRSMPVAVALELALGGRIDAARAHQVGFLNRVVAPDQVLSSALELAERVVALSPAAVRATRELMYASQELPLADFGRVMKSREEELMAGPDAAEGQAAFLAKRSPQWPSADHQEIGGSSGR